MTKEDRQRLLRLATKLDEGGLTTAEHFKLAHLIRQFMEERDANLAEIKRLVRLNTPQGWGLAR